MRRNSAILLAAVLALSLAACGDTPPYSAPPAADQTASPSPTKAKATPTPTPIPSPSPTPSPTPDITKFDPVAIQGKGDTVTELVTVPVQYSAVSFAHDGKSNFIVRQYDGDFDRQGSLVNEIGKYTGSTLLDCDGEVIFEVEADGAWSIEIKPLEAAAQGDFSGTGSQVSGVFPATSKGVWEFAHAGKSNFIVRVYTSSGRDGVVNEIGKYSGSAVVDFGNDFAFWVVHADGAWSISQQK